MLQELFDLFKSQGWAIDGQRDDIIADPQCINEKNYHALKAIKGQLVDISDFLGNADIPYILGQIEEITIEIDEYFEE